MSLFSVSFNRRRIFLILRKKTIRIKRFDAFCEPNNTKKAQSGIIPINTVETMTPTQHNGHQSPQAHQPHLAYATEPRRPRSF